MQVFYLEKFAVFLFDCGMLERDYSSPFPLLSGAAIDFGSMNSSFS